MSVLILYNAGALVSASGQSVWCGVGLVDVIVRGLMFSGGVSDNLGNDGNFLIRRAP